MEQPYYSKKIIERFMHPRNAGKIKNADGVGDTQNLRCGDLMKIYIKVGKKGGQEIIQDAKFETMGCLPPQEKVLVNYGEWEEVSSVKKDATVLNSDGIQTQVVRTFSRSFSGDLMTITPFVSPFNRFAVTIEHPILSVKRKDLKSTRKSGKSWLRVSREELLSAEPDFVPTSELEKGDYLVFVSNKKVKDKKEFSVEIMRLIGYYLAEGYLINNDGVINFAFNKNEKDNILEVEGLIRHIVGKESSKRIRRNVAEIRVCSRHWSKFFKKVCGTYAIHKKLSEEILVLPFTKQWEMIKTYIKGDGSSSIRRKGNSPRYEITTASLDLAIQMQEIFARGGIFASVRKRKFDPSRNYIEGRHVFSHPVYDLFYRLNRGKRFFHFDDKKKQFLIPIKKITRKHFTGRVHNFTVQGEPNSYLVKGFAVHNCGHALAISDMICDLIKGKTFEEAIKVGYEDISDDIGPVPPVKVHCAKLAQAAVKAAIEDYQNKKIENRK